MHIIRLSALLAFSGPVLAYPDVELAPRTTITMPLRSLDVVPIQTPLPSSSQRAARTLLRRQQSSSSPFNTVCGYINGDPNLPTTCSLGSHCVVDTGVGAIGCCPNEGPCSTGIYTSCVDFQSPQGNPATQDPYVYTCPGSLACYQNQFNGGYFQYGCGAASLSAQVSEVTSLPTMSGSVTLSNEDSSTEEVTSTATSADSDGDDDDDEGPITSNKKRTGIIVGSIIAGLAGLVAIIALCAYFARRQKRHTQPTLPEESMSQAPGYPSRGPSGGGVFGPAGTAATVAAAGAGAAAGTRGVRSSTTSSQSTLSDEQLRNDGSRAGVVGAGTAGAAAIGGMAGAAYGDKHEDDGSLKPPAPSHPASTQGLFSDAAASYAAAMAGGGQQRQGPRPVQLEDVYEKDATPLSPVDQRELPPSSAFFYQAGFDPMNLDKTTSPTHPSRTRDQGGVLSEIEEEDGSIGSRSVESAILPPTSAFYTSYSTPPAQHADRMNMDGGRSTKSPSMFGVSASSFQPGPDDYAEHPLPPMFTHTANPLLLQQRLSSPVSHPMTPPPPTSPPSPPPPRQRGTSTSSATMVNDGPQVPISPISISATPLQHYATHYQNEPPISPILASGSPSLFPAPLNASQSSAPQRARPSPPPPMSTESEYRNRSHSLPTAAGDGLDQGNPRYSGSVPTTPERSRARVQPFPMPPVSRHE